MSYNNDKICSSFDSTSIYNWKGLGTMPERKRFKRKLKILDLMYNSTLGTITVIRNIYLVTV